MLLHRNYLRTILAGWRNKLIFTYLPLVPNDGIAPPLLRCKLRSLLLQQSGIWLSWKDLNFRSLVYQTSALNQLCYNSILVSMVGFEPTTLGLEVPCSSD